MWGEWQMGTGGQFATNDRVYRFFGGETVASVALPKVAWQGFQSEMPQTNISDRECSEL